MDGSFTMDELVFGSVGHFPDSSRKQIFRDIFLIYADVCLIWA